MNQSVTENRPQRLKVGWIEISSKKHGGFIYREEARQALSKEFDVELVSCEPKYLKDFKYLKMLEAFFNVFKLKGEKDIWIRDYFPALMMRTKKTKGINIVMVHHIDIEGLPKISIPIFRVLTKIFFHNLWNADAIITRAEIWRKHFSDLGYKNVYKIYGGSDLEKFKFSEQEISDFKKANNLLGKPVIYIGNRQKAKGVLETYEALKDLEVHLVTTGVKDVELPAPHFDLSYRDYLKLLTASSVVITMSTFKEGWCRTAHEAMLCRTPVIGSGLGGMKELLEGGNQIICTDFPNLKSEVDNLLNNPQKREDLGKKGYDFVKQFTLEKFGEDWRNTIKNILQKNGKNA
ncbi:MAG: glycosyltransferase family 4 protein [Patescibacteria group bacterium]